MTEQQFLTIQHIYPRTSFYPLEVEALFKLFEELEGWNPGCRTCPSNVTFVKDRIYPKISGYIEEKQKAVQQKEENINKEEIKLKAKKKK